MLADTPPVGGRIRAEAEDFHVTEVPLYNFCGRGEHLYLTITKTNRTTLQIVDYLAKNLRIQTLQIGFAGFKDKRAVTQQTFSIQGAKEEDVRPLDAPWMRIDAITYHKNKLRAGHLSANRFRIKVRDAEAGSLPRAQAMVAELRRIGVPNFYGPQRFGRFGDSHRIGRAMLHRNPQEVADVLMGPRPEAPEPFRDLYAAGHYAQALEELPLGRPTEAAMLHCLRRQPGNFRAAVRRIPREMRRMYFSAYQSYLFNWALRERLEAGREALSTVEVGDLAYIHTKGACFLVTPDELADSQERAAQHEISPSGPIFGRKMTFAEGRPGEFENSILATEGMRPKSFLSHVKGLHLDGSRRTFRVPVKDVEVVEEIEDDEGTSLVFSFTLPPGSYATMLLEEVMGEGRTRPPRLDVEEPGAQSVAELGAESEE
ncbi:MAG: tRNA pseudouridine(13) synthase TruD [Planctomycetota bacterium]